ncbi:MAG TPA: carbohydrate kinase, partial [Anaerolineae bacterium]|nr:carbohydrate kinase [Anaerolineae bacterium]
PKVDIAMIGHFAKDHIVIQGRREIASGGGVYYGSIALCRHGLSVAVVTRLRSEDFPMLDEMKNEGVLVFAHPAPQTSGIENIYYTADMDRRICKPLGFAGPFRSEEIPLLDTQMTVITPIMAGEVNLALVQELAAKGPIALDAQGFVRVREGDELVFQDWPEKEAGLACVHTLKVDSAEAEVLTGKTDMHQAARELAAYGPKEIVLTHAHGVLVFADNQYHEATFHPRQVQGRTGRGDTCFATYVGRRLTTPPAEACQFAAAVTSLKMEHPGPFQGSLADVEAFLTQQIQMT